MRSFAYGIVGCCVLVAGSLGTPATAQEALPEWDIRIHGGYVWRNQFSGPVIAERVDIGGTPTALGTEAIAARDNWTGGFALRRRLAGTMDVGFGYTGIVGTTERRSLTSDIPVALILPGLITTPVTSAAGGIALTARTRATHHVADLDAGFDVDGIGSGSLKLIGGVRFAHYSQTTTVDLATAFFPVSADFSHRRRDSFIGAGPRLAVQWSQPLWTGFSLNASVGGGVVFGQQRIATTTSGAGGLATGETEERHGRVAYNGEGEIAVTYAWSTGLYAAIGYQASAWFGLRDNRRELDAAATLAADPNAANFIGGGKRRPVDLNRGPFFRVGLKW